MFVFLAQNETDRKAKVQLAHDYYGRFDNIYIKGPGIVKHGMIKPLPRQCSVAETDANLTICTPSEMIDKLGPYAEAGIDRFIMNVNFGASQTDTLECLQCFAEEVMPYFTTKK